MEKVIRDGKVAVLYSPGFGAGWFTWNTEHPDLMYDPEVVRMVQEDRRKEIQEHCDQKYGENEIYCGGADDLEIRWLPMGTQFRINEYDGSESIITNDEEHWYIA